MDVSWFVVMVLAGALGALVVRLLVERRDSQRYTKSAIDSMALQRDDALTSQVLQKKQDENRLADQQRQFQAQSQEANERHTAELRQREERLVLAQQSIASLDAEVVQTQAERDALQEHMAKAWGWDRGSRRRLIALCESMGIDAVLATNVVFLSRNGSGDPFITQIDHVLLTAANVILIENKYWSGVVLDGKHPDQIHPALGLLFPLPHIKIRELEGKDFAIQIRRSSGGEGSASLRVHPLADETRRVSPRDQVRQQAARLSVLVKEAADGWSPWIDTCVFYSHMEALVLASQTDADQTPVAANDDELREVLKGFMQTPRSGSHGDLVDIVCPLLDDLGADLYGMGAYRDAWPPLISPTVGESGSSE